MKRWKAESGIKSWDVCFNRLLDNTGLAFPVQRRFASPAPEASDDDEIILATKNGMIVRVPVKDIRIQGRNTMGVTIMKLNKGDKVVSVAKVIINDD